MLELTRANFGDYHAVDRIKGGGVCYYLDGKHYDVEDPLREIAWGDYDYGLKSEAGLPPFTRADFGRRDRLAWGDHACAIPRDASLVVLEQRFAFWREDDMLSAVDARLGFTLHLTIPGLLDEVRTIAAHDKRLWLEARSWVAWFGVTDFELAFVEVEGQFPVRVRETYPMRRTNTVGVFVTGMSKTETRTHTLDKRRAIALPLQPELAVGTELELHDEVMIGYFLGITLPGAARRPLRPEPPQLTEIEASARFERAVDPAGVLAKPSDSARQDELDRLFAARAEDPEDPATPMVIIDLLEEAGEPYAMQLAQLVGGENSATARLAALGTLASYISTTDYRGGLPYRGVLSPTAPLDDDIGNLVAVDQRLGFYHTILIGEGDYRVYIKLVASSRTAGLRCIEAPRAQILTALIANGRKNLTRIMGVKFVNREVIEALADPTFDGLREIETETTVAAAPRLLEFIARDELGFFKRAPRNVILRERTGSPLIVQPVLAAWKALPVAAMTIGNIELRRDGTADMGVMPNPHVLEAIRGTFKLV